MSKTCFQNAQKWVFLGIFLQNFPKGMPPTPRMVVPSALPLKLIFDVTWLWRHTTVTKTWVPLGNFLRTPLAVANHFLCSCVAWLHLWYGPRVRNKLLLLIELLDLGELSTNSHIIFKTLIGAYLNFPSKKTAFIEVQANVVCFLYFNLHQKTASVKRLFYMLALLHLSEVAVLPCCLE